MKAKVQSHWAQRSNDVEVDEGEIMEEYCMAAAAPAPGGFGGVGGGGLGNVAPPPPARAAAATGYRNMKKKSMLNKAFGFSKS